MLKNPDAIRFIIAITPDQNFEGRDFDKPPGGAVIITKVPFVLVVKLVGQQINGVMVGYVGFSFNDDNAKGIG